MVIVLFVLQDNFSSQTLLWCSVNGAGLTHWFRLRFGQRAHNIYCLECRQTGKNMNIWMKLKMSGEQAGKGGGV